MMSDDETLRGLQIRAAGIIDSPWHFSWHWDKKESGHLTLQGWRDAIQDGITLAEQKRQDAIQIDFLVQELLDHVLKLQDTGVIK